MKKIKKLKIERSVLDKAFPTPFETHLNLCEIVNELIKNQNEIIDKLTEENNE